MGFTQKARIFFLEFEEGKQEEGMMGLKKKTRKVLGFVLWFRTRRNRGWKRECGIGLIEEGKREGAVCVLGRGEYEELQWSEG